MNWVQSLLPEGQKGFTDGKTIRSTGKMVKYESALHIISAHVADLGITLAQKTVDDKSIEIPAVQELIRLLKIMALLYFQS